MEARQENVEDTNGETIKIRGLEGKGGVTNIFGGRETSPILDTSWASISRRPIMYPTYREIYIITHYRRADSKFITGLLCLMPRSHRCDPLRWPGRRRLYVILNCTCRNYGALLGSAAFAGCPHPCAPVIRASFFIWVDTHSSGCKGCMCGMGRLVFEYCVCCTACA